MAALFVPPALFLFVPGPLCATASAVLRPVETAERDEVARRLLLPEDPIPDIWDIILQEDNATNHTAAEVTGVHMNTKGDFALLAASVKLNLLLAVVYTSLFCGLRQACPLMYSYYSMGLDGIPQIDKYYDTGEEEGSLAAQRAPRALPGRGEGLLRFHLGWIPAAFNITGEVDLEKFVGLDQALMLEFCNLCIRIFATISIPMVAIMAPLHYFLAGQHAADLDRISQTGMASIKQESFLWWVHAAIVWAVVFVTTRYINKAHLAFTQRHDDWLATLREPRATTILVQGIPKTFQSDEALRSYFVHMFSQDNVEAAHVLKNLKSLPRLLPKLEGAVLRLRASLEESGDRGDPGKKALPLLDKALHGADAITDSADRVRDLLETIESERSSVMELAQKAGHPINSSCGFVRFAHRRDVQVAMYARFSSDAEYWEVARAPAADDVAFDVLAGRDDGGPQKCVREFCAYVVLFALFNFYMTSVVFITTVAELIKDIAGVFRPMLEAIVPTIGLMLFMSFLPTILLLIFRLFFRYESESSLQRLLFKWYFWFLVIFVVLVTLVGTSPVLLALKIVDDPESTPALLASALPGSSNFYITYVILLTSSHFLNLTRYMNVIKYWIHRARGVKPLQAWALSEPEDQDFYGIGSRSARWSVVAVIGLVYCQICPALGLVVLLNFLVCRLVYGYLICFAETRKPDMGGEVWVDQLHNLQYCLVIYILLMSGVLIEGGGRYCGIASLLSLLYLWRSYRQFSLIWWRYMPFERVPSAEECSEDGGGGSSFEVYVQPELRVSKLELEARRLLDEATAATTASSRATAGTEANGQEEVEEEVDGRRGECWGLASLVKGCVRAQGTSITAGKEVEATNTSRPL